GVNAGLLILNHTVQYLSIQGSEAQAGAIRCWRALAAGWRGDSPLFRLRGFWTEHYPPTPMRRARKHLMSNASLAQRHHFPDGCRELPIVDHLPDSFEPFRRHADQEELRANIVTRRQVLVRGSYRRYENTPALEHRERTTLRLPADGVDHEIDITRRRFE